MAADQTVGGQPEAGLTRVEVQRRVFFGPADRNGAGQVIVAQQVAVGRVAAGIARGRGVGLDEAAELHGVVADAEAFLARGGGRDGRSGRSRFQADDVLRHGLRLGRLLRARGGDLGFQAVQLGLELGDARLEGRIGVLRENGAGREQKRSRSRAAE
ncbi:hypothetical protein D3C71_1657850 [compost metagenome]